MLWLWGQPVGQLEAVVCLGTAGTNPRHHLLQTDRPAAVSGGWRDWVTAKRIALVCEPLALIKIRSDHLRFSALVRPFVAAVHTRNAKFEAERFSDCSSMAPFVSWR